MNRLEAYSLIADATEDEQIVLYSYIEQKDISDSFMKKVQELGDQYVHLPATQSLAANLANQLTEYLRILSYDYPLLRMPFVGFDLKVVFQLLPINMQHRSTSGYSATVMLESSALQEIINCEYGKAAEALSVANAIKTRIERNRAEKLAIFLDKHYEHTGIKKADYPVTTPMTATQLRNSGTIPVGYELVPIEILDLLCFAGMHTYSIAVGGDGMQTKIEQAAKALTNIMMRRQTNGKKI